MNGVMMYTLQRHTQSDKGTFGTLSDAGGLLLCHTCELPWNDNKPETSCIPSGFYNCIPHNSPAHPNTWEVTGVPNRSEILIHNGNIIEESKGCILVGMNEGWLNSEWAVLNSMQALNFLRNTLPDNFSLSVLDIADQ